MAGAHQTGRDDGGAAHRARPVRARPEADMSFTDVWADTSKPASSPRSRSTSSTPATPTRPTTCRPRRRSTASSTTRSTSRRSGHGRAAPAAPTPAPTATPTRPSSTCATAISGTGRVTSYEELVLGDPVIDPVTGQPQTRSRKGVPMIVRGPALVANRLGRRGRHGALEPARRDPLRRDAQGGQRGARRASESADERARPLDAAQRRPRNVLSPSGWTSAGNTSTTRSTAASVRS
jgi:hypothetical protein